MCKYYYMNVETITWLLIVMTLPTQNATARMRIWRGLKGLGCAALRDGAWLLPETATTRQALEALASETHTEGGTAWLLQLNADASQSSAFREMFDRTPEYGELLTDLMRFDPLAFDASANKTLKALRRRFGQPRHPLHQHVAISQQANHQAVKQDRLANNHL